MQTPYDEKIEKSLLGVLIVDPAKIYDILDYIEPQDFFIETHQEIYQAMLDNPDKIDVVTLNKKIKEPQLLASLSQDFVTSSNIKEYADAIKDLSIRRQLLKTNSKNERIIGDDNKDIESVLALVQNSVLEIGLYKKQDDTATSAVEEVEDLQSVYEEKREHGQDLLGYSCGFPTIDEAIDGLRPHHVWIVGAFTSYGKTQVTLNIVNAVLNQGVPTAIISLEMSRVDMIARLIAIRTNINSRKILKGLVTPDEFEQIKSAKEFLKKSPLLLHTNYFDIEKIKYIIRKDHITNHTKVFVLDYLQNIRGDGKEYDMITKAVIELQSLAREYNITLILVSQISNEAQKGQGAGAGFKGSGHIEAVADLAIRLKRDKKTEVVKDGKTVSPVKITVDIAKNRHGITGSSEFSLFLESGLFKEGYESIPEEYQLDI